MVDQFRKTVIRMSFEAVLDRLNKELEKEGFEVGGITDFQHPTKNEMSRQGRKHKVLAVYSPFLYSEMIDISPFEGIILPCFISVIENHPGEVSLVPFNATERIVRGIDDPSLQNLAVETSRRLALAIHALEKEQLGTPDPITAWE